MGSTDTRRPPPIVGSGILLALLLGLSLPTWADLKPDSLQDEISETEFVLGNIEFALLHELAHVLISEKEIPVLGSEESAADQIATIFLVRGEGVSQAQTKRLRAYAEMTALAFSTIWGFVNEIGASNPYWDAHGLSIQRYYNILCLIRGSDPTGELPLAVLQEFPAQYAEACPGQFRQADRAVRWLLRTYGRKPRDSRGADIHISFEEPRTKVEVRLLGDLRRRRLIESTFEAFQERFFLHRPLDVMVRGCGIAEAHWDPDNREMIICYELLDAYRMLYIRATSRDG